MYMLPLTHNIFWHIKVKQTPLHQSLWDLSAVDLNPRRTIFSRMYILKH